MRSSPEDRSLENALVSLISDASPRHLSKDVIEAAKLVLLDSLAIGVAGAKSPFQQPLSNVVEQWGSGGSCRILGRPEGAPAPSAAFLNAFQIHCLEFDAVHEAAVAHVATAPIAALLAELDQQTHPVLGARLVTALVVGIEVAATLGLAADAPLGFFRPATSGVFGAAAAVASLRSFDAQHARACLGYALASAAGTMQPHEEGVPTLPIQLAAAARSGLIAADLAASEIPTVEEAISGRFGYLAMFESKVACEGLAEDLARPWRVTQMSLKPFPSGRATHGGIEAVIRLRDHGVRAEQVESLKLLAPPLINQLVNRPAKPDMNVNYARLCFPYVAARALQQGRLEIEDFTAEKLAQHDTLALADRVSVCTNQETNPSAFTPQRLTATCRDGAEHSIDIQHLLGSPEHPMTPRQRQEKVDACLSSGALQPDRAERLARTLEELWMSEDVRDFHHCLVP